MRFVLASLVHIVLCPLTFDPYWQASRGALYPSLNTSVEVWSDFLRIHLHPNSTLMVPGHFHNESKLVKLRIKSKLFSLSMVHGNFSPQGSFDMYPAGLQAWEDRKVTLLQEATFHMYWVVK